jgi:hypothetical protein
MSIHVKGELPQELLSGPGAVEPLRFSYHGNAHYNSVLSAACKYPLGERGTSVIRDHRKAERAEAASIAEKAVSVHTPSLSTLRFVACWRAHPFSGRLCTHAHHRVPFFCASCDRLCHGGVTPALLFTVGEAAHEDASVTAAVHGRH